MSEPTEPASRSRERTTASERRVSPRYLSDLDTACRVAGANRTELWHARVHDLSTGGVGLILKRRFEPGTLLSFVLEGRTPDCIHSYLARVVHVTPHEGGCWRLGCRLVGEIGEEELHAFGAGRVKSSGEDTRAWVRFACQVETLCRPAGSGVGPPVPAVIVDISPGGMRLLCPTPLEPGSLLSVPLPSTPTLHVQVQVLRLRRDHDGWHVGCAFADRLGPEELASPE